MLIFVRFKFISFLTSPRNFVFKPVQLHHRRCDLFLSCGTTIIDGAICRSADHVLNLDKSATQLPFDALAPCPKSPDVESPDIVDTGSTDGQNQFAARMSARPEEKCWSTANSTNTISKSPVFGTALAVSDGN